LSSDIVSNSSDNNLRRKLTGLILLGLAVRAVMPAGYMPAPIGEGGPFVLCPGSLSGATLILAAQAQAAGHHGDQYDHGSGDGSHFWEFCAFGAALGAAAIGNDADLVLPVFEQVLISTRSELPARSPGLHPFDARAPPPLKSRSA
jgi:hypothetical protein